MCLFRGGGASEELGGRGEHAELAPLVWGGGGGGGVWGHAPPGKYACSEIDYSHLEASETKLTQINGIKSSASVGATYLKSRVRQYMRRCVRRCIFSDDSETNAHADWKNSLH